MGVGNRFAYGNVSQGLFNKLLAEGQQASSRAQAAVIFRPGAPSSGYFVATWPEVQAVVAASAGNVYVMVDDSIAPCVVPGASGVTDFQGRGEIRPYRADVLNFSTLLVEDGATLKSIARIVGTVWIRFDTQGAVPGLDFDYAPNVVGAPTPALVIEQFGAIGMTPTASAPGCVVPPGQLLAVQMSFQGGTFTDVAPLFHLADGTASIVINSFGSEIRDTSGLLLAPATWVTGAGNATFNYDATTIAYSSGLPQMSAAVNIFHCNDSFQRSVEFTATSLDVLSGFQAAAELAQVGTVVIRVEGFGGSGGAGGGTGGSGITPGVGGGGGGGVMNGSASIDFDLSHKLDIQIGAGGAGGAGGAAGGGAGGLGLPGGPSYCQDATSTLVLTSFLGAGGAGGNRGGNTWPSYSVTSPEPSKGGDAGAAGVNGDAGGIARVSKNNNLPGATWLGGTGGVSGGGGGGGGGAGVFASGAAGGAANAPGVAAAPGTGSGGGGGGGGTTVADAGGAGGNGAAGRIRITFVAPSGIPG